MRLCLFVCSFVYLYLFLPLSLFYHIAYCTERSIWCNASTLAFRLLLERYHHELQATMQEAKYLSSRIESAQDIINLSLASRRNALLTVQVHATVAAVGIGISTAIAGFFGMNVPIPVEVETMPGRYVKR